MYRTCNGGLPGSEGCEGHDEEARLCNTDECEGEEEDREGWSSSCRLLYFRSSLRASAIASG